VPTPVARLIGVAPPGAREMLTNAGSLVGSVAVTSILGFPYWWLAARGFPAHDVGFAATVVSTVTLLGTFGMLGLGTLLTGELSRRGSNVEAFIASGLAMCSVAGLVVALFFALVLAGPLGLSGLADHPVEIAVFATGVVLTAVTLVIDQALLGLLRGGVQLRRNIIFSVSKLVLLGAVVLVAFGRGGVGIYATWAAGLAVSLLWLALRVARRSGLRRYRPSWAVIRQWRRPALEHHALNLAIQGPTLATPLVVSATVSVTAAAYFYAAQLITSFFAYGAIALTYALYAIGVRDPDNLRVPLRFTLRLSFAVIAVADVVLLLGADLILRIFGTEYATHAANALRVIAVLLFALVVKDHYIAIHRIRGTVLTGARVCLVGGTLELGFAALGGSYGGLTWFAFGALVALMLEAMVMAPTIVRELRGVER
jgi:O-antigen/teichoic acid export membrane protein